VKRLRCGAGNSVKRLKAFCLARDRPMAAVIRASVRASASSVMERHPRSQSSIPTGGMKPQVGPDGQWWLPTAPDAVARLPLPAGMCDPGGDMDAFVNRAGWARCLHVDSDRRGNPPEEASKTAG